MDRCHIKKRIDKSGRLKTKNVQMRAIFVHEIGTIASILGCLRMGFICSRNPYPLAWKDFENAKTKKAARIAKTI
jgi:hypothetical protein